MPSKQDAVDIKTTLEQHCTNYECNPTVYIWLHSISFQAMKLHCTFKAKYITKSPHYIVSSMMALTISPSAFFRALTAFARLTLACVMTSSISLGSTPLSSTSPSSSSSSIRAVKAIARCQGVTGAKRASVLQTIQHPHMLRSKLMPQTQSGPLPTCTQGNS